jgi:hypothetical protein
MSSLAEVVAQFPENNFRIDPKSLRHKEIKKYFDRFIAWFKNSVLRLNHAHFSGDYLFRQVLLSRENKMPLSAEPPRLNESGTTGRLLFPGYL